MSQKPLIVSALLVSACAAGHPALMPPEAPGRTYDTGGLPGEVPREVSEGAQTPRHVVVEASAVLAVRDVTVAAAAIAESARELEGRLVKQEIQAGAHFAAFRIRLPPERLDALFRSLEALGEVQNRTVTETDVSKQMVDTAIQLENLQHALARYRAILQAATGVEEMLSVERELTRIRGEIERIKGERAYLADRAALATVELTVVRTAGDVDFAPEAKLHPGARFSHFGLYRNGQAPRGLVGPGLSLWFDRAAHFQVDLLTDLGGDLDTVDGVVATYGADVYSDYFGRGRRRWLNPHLGLSLGYAGFDGHGAFTAAAVAGLELFKTEYVLIDANVGLHGLMGAEEISGLGVQSTLSVHVAF